MSKRHTNAVAPTAIPQELSTEAAELAALEAAELAELAALEAAEAKQAEPEAADEVQALATDRDPVEMQAAAPEPAEPAEPVEPDDDSDDDSDELDDSDDPDDSDGSDGSDDAPAAALLRVPAGLSKVNVTVTLDVPTIMTMEGHPAPVVGEDKQGRMVVTYKCDSNNAALRTAKAAARELVRFRLAKGVLGHREGKEISFTFGVGGAELPLTWLGRKGRRGKPEELGEIQAALQGYNATYFNSSVNEGITVADDKIPVGLQFVFDKESGDLVAKVLKSAQVGGGKTWTDHPLDSPEQALALVKRLELLFEDL